jgi:hypothetical protein
MRPLLCCVVLAFSTAVFAAETPASPAKEALKPFNDLVGSWGGTGEPEGTRAEKLKGFWTETIGWEWQFKGDDVSMKIAFDKGKYFKSGDLHYLADKKLFRLNVTTPEQKSLVFEGSFENKRLTLDRVDPETKDTQRLVFTLLHPNRHLYRYEVKKAESPSFVKQYQVGATKKGVPFATGDGYPECIVSGGRGTMPVMHKGKTYYVCCTGCRDEFKENPEKYIKEYEAKKGQK